MLLIAAFTFTEYGISWDEQVSRSHGRDTVNYIIDNDNNYLTHPNMDYSIFFEVILYAAESMYSHITGQYGKVDKLNFDENVKYIYLLRHFIIHLFFYSLLFLLIN